LERFRPNHSAVTYRGSSLFILLAVLAMAVFSSAKEKSLTAILLYEGPSGPAYEQLTDVTLNGKTEVYVCSKESKLDNSGYRKLPRTSLANGLELQRDSDGALVMKTTEGLTCIAPENLKIDKNTQLTPKDLADRTGLQATVLAKSVNSIETIPELKGNFKLYFAPANDTELAEYLRAAHWHTIDLLRMYTMQYPNGAHIGEVRQTLAGIVTTNAESELAAYMKSVADNAPLFEHLRGAKTQTDDALHALPGFVRAEKLALDVRAQIQEIVSQGRGELRTFQNALAERKPGYDHLQRAHALAQDAQGVDPALESVQKLVSEINDEDQNLDLAILTAQGLISRKQFDQAYTTIQRYRVMAPELPKVAAIVDTAFAYRRDQGNDFVKQSQWEPAINEFRRALGYKDDEATAAALKNAEQQLQLQKDKAAAEVAIASSKDLAEKKQYVEAYELLANLPAEQRKYVAEPLEEFQKPFVQDAVKRSESLTRLHLPVRGRADEDAIREAFHLLTVVVSLNDDEAVKVKLDLLSDRISDYYLGQARRMFDKPRGSGAGLGWKFLQQAQHFKPDLAAVKDEMTKHEPIYEMRSKLSLGIRFRDQTSRRDSMGFADQLTDAVAANLESSGITALKVVTSQSRTGEGAIDTNSGLEPNFQLQCDILQHRVSKKVDSQRVKSHYRAGTHEVRNPAWTDLKRGYDAATDDYNRLKDLVIASGKKVKPEVASKLQELQARVEEARKKLDTVPETKLEEVIQEYNYTRRTIEVTGVVEFAFRLASAGEAPTQQTNVKMEVPKTSTVLENVKPEDTDGVQEEGTPLDELQVLNEVELQAQAGLIAKVSEKLRGLSPHLLDDARKKAVANDLDAAAESYILYLNCTPESDSAERVEALRFLEHEYNIRAGE